MKFYIVTPCFNSLRWLQNAIRSVADQVGEGVEVHHHVQDGLSSDGTPAWLEEWRQSHTDVPGYTFTYESAKDAGMYDAINTAWAKMPADADVTAHLNSDEQYLPGALRGVAAAFAKHPKADILSCSYIVTDADGNYHCHRRPVQPTRFISTRICELTTCTTFHRAAAFRTHGVRFRTDYRIFGDVLFFRDIMNQRVHVRTAPRLISSAFAMTGDNLAWRDSSKAEMQRLITDTPRLHILLFPLTSRLTGLRRRLSDFILPAPRICALYHDGEQARREETITRPTAQWRPNAAAN